MTLCTPFLALVAVSASSTLPMALKQVSAADFFPLTDGFRASYTRSTPLLTKVDQQVGTAVPLGDGVATPVATYRDGKKVEEVFYRAVNDEIQIVAYDAKHILPEPRTFIKVGPGKSHWEFKGTTVFVKESVPIEIKGESHSGGTRKVLGKLVETLIVTLDATVGKPGVDAYSDHQEIIFGKGIGIVQLDETVIVEGQKHTQQMKLTGFEQGGKL